MKISRSQNAPTQNSPKMIHLKKNLFLLTTVALIFPSVFIGCSSKPDPEVIAFVQEEQETALSITLEEIPKFQIPNPDTYTSTQLRSPFEPCITAQLEQPCSEFNSDASREFERPKHVLENYPLDSLKMVGILKTQERCWAIIRESNGRVHSAQVGHYIGQHQGRITKIEETGLEIEELTQIDPELEPESKLQFLPLAKS